MKQPKSVNWLVQGPVSSVFSRGRAVGLCFTSEAEHTDTCHALDFAASLAVLLLCPADLDFLVALQAFLTVVGNCTCWFAAWRIYTAAQAEQPSS